MKPEPAWPARFTIAPAKITAYLLDPNHADGGPKCAFLTPFGLTPRNPEDLARALLFHARRDTFVGFVPARKAVKLYFEGLLAAPADRWPNVRTVWQMDDDDRTRAARFITLKPLPRLDVLRNGVSDALAEGEASGEPFDMETFLKAKRDAGPDTGSR